MISRRRVLTYALAVTPLAVASQASAQDFSARPIELIIGFAAGSSSDLLARYYGAELTEALGTPVIVINSPGASQYVAISQLMNARPDGHTIMLAAASALSSGPVLRDDLPYDPLTDFVPFSLVATAPGVFTATTSIEQDTLPDFIEHARQNPGSLNYGSSGVGSSSHLQMELLKSIVDVDIAHIPYEGAGQINTALIQGEVHIGIGPIEASLPSIEGGNVKALAITGSRRSVLLPDVPSLSELGNPELSALDPYTYYMMIAPNGTPPEVLEALNAAFNAVNEMEKTTDYLSVRGFDVTTSTVEGSQQYIMNDRTIWETFKTNTGFVWGE